MCLSDFLCFNGVCGFHVCKFLVDYMFLYEMFVFISSLSLKSRGCLVAHFLCILRSILCF
jgi:hypothetical protein